MKPVKLTREEYEALIQRLTGLEYSNPMVYEARFAVDKDGLKVAINNSPWSQGVGKVTS